MAMKFQKKYKNLLSALFVFVIAFSSFLAFEPLFEHLGQKASQEFAAAIFGTIFAAVITMVLLNKQTETEVEKSRSEKVFEQKITLYNQVIDTLQGVFEKQVDGAEIKLNRSEITQLEFLLAKMMMIGNDKTINEFKAFYEIVTNNYSPQTQTLYLDSSDKQIVFRFADYCREELGLSDKTLEKEILEDIVLQGELFYNIEETGELHPNLVDTIKDIYGYLVFDLDLPTRNIVFKPNGFNAYISKRREDKMCFLQCTFNIDSVRLVLEHDHIIKGFAKNKEDNKSIFLFESDDRKKVKLYISDIERAIKQSYMLTKKQMLNL